MRTDVLLDEKFRVRSYCSREYPVGRSRDIVFRGYQASLACVGCVFRLLKPSYGLLSSRELRTGGIRRISTPRRCSGIQIRFL